MLNIIERQRQWPIIDKIYNNITEANTQAKTDNVLLGRFILIKYSDQELTNKRKLELMKEYSNITLEEIEKLTSINKDEKTFLKNWKIDTIESNTEGISKDRLILQKNAFYDKNNNIYKLEYKEITYLAWADLEEMNIEIFKLDEAIKTNQKDIEQLKNSMQSELKWEDYLMEE